MNSSQNWSNPIPLTLNLSSQDPIYHQALQLVEDGESNAFQQLLEKHQVNPNFNECEFLRQSIVHNHPIIFWYLLPFYQNNIDNSDLLCEASSLNREDFVVALLPYTNPHVNQSEPLMWAARHNNTTLMDLLLPISNVFDAIELVNKYAPEAQDSQTQCHKGLRYLHHWLTDQLHSAQKDGHKKI